MKASELRIGNSIMQDEDFVFVTYWRLKLIEDGVLIYKPIFSFPCKYVHQLQNIYYSIIGEELEIK